MTGYGFIPLNQNYDLLFTEIGEKENNQTIIQNKGVWAWTENFKLPICVFCKLANLSI